MSDMMSELSRQASDLHSRMQTRRVRSKKALQASKKGVHAFFGAAGGSGKDVEKKRPRAAEVHHEELEEALHGVRVTGGLKEGGWRTWRVWGKHPPAFGARVSRHSLSGGGFYMVSLPKEGPLAREELPVFSTNENSQADGIA